ncbi:matrixin family metalloprotease [uncultured Aquimarina sp.]|uniref:matrixin family metalloprotease n=1 Tax=uncultured Aquimarina sp. TaxID=575652 RepID=UPI002620B08E|nr:matrixin family metalloprotease [uncultured Aquimarina sp.]
MKRIVLILIFLCLPISIFAQECSALMKPISLKERIAEASIIIEGVIVSSEAHWDTKRRNIYTVHTIETYKSFKGSTGNTLKVVTLGGQVDGAIQITSSAPNLSKGTTGIFLMKDFNKEMNVEGRLYQLVAAAQGVVKYSKYTDEASDLFNKYPSIENELYGRIQLSTNRAFTNLKNRPVAQSKSFAKAAPIVYSFSPLTATAGTQTVLTITGNNFGTDTGSVGFSNANDGASSYTTALDSQVISWSNTEIQVEIPYLAGTGSIVVTNTDNESQTTTVPLTISYSHLNGSTGTNEYPNVLQDDNGNGGFTFVYHTDFDTSSAKTYFEDAFELWNCESSINFVFDGTTTTDESVEDGVNIVRFDNGSELASGVLGQVTTRYLGSCVSTGKAIVNEIDITWDDSTNWYYGNGDPSSSQYDFKTVALHELGHAHQLGHVIDTDLVMHYSLGAGENKYNLASNDIAAAQYVMGEFTESPGCGVTPMSSNVLCCDDIAISSQPQDISIGENGSGQFSVTASGYDSVSWFSSADGNSWTALSDDSIYSGTTTATLTLSNVPANYDGLFYRAYLENNCSEFLNTDQATLTVYGYTAIPDANFEAALEALGYDDISGNGQVPTYLIENVTSLDVQYSNISDLTGIEDFTALQFIQVRNNSLTTLDLSANTALITVAFRENSIATLDISNSPNITDIYGAFNNLTTINLSNNTLLEVLAIRNNSLSILDLSTNAALTQVNVRNNSLTSIDLRNGANTILSSTDFTGNANLTCILVDDAAYSTTNWTNVEATTNFSDTSYCGYTTIPDTNFEAALEALGYDDISNDGQVPTALIENVTSLQIGDNSINDVTGLEDFTSLTELDFYQIGLSSIDLSNNTLLEKVSLDNNPLTNIDLTALVNLTELSLELTDITGIDVSANTALVVLDVSDNDLLNSLNVRNGNNANFTLFDATNNASLSCILVDDEDYSNTNWSGNIDSETNFTETNYCVYTSIPDANFETALEAQGYDDILGDGQVPTVLIEGITNLDLSSESIVDFTGIEDFTALIDLNISDNSITTLDLSNNTSIKYLQANSCGFTSLDISQNTNLEELSAYSNSLTSLNTNTNTSLNHLTLYNNQISSLDLSSNTALTYVEVNDNQLTEFNIQNGTNTLIQTFDTTGNSNLFCIVVDDVAYSITNWINIDSQTSFSAVDCNYTAIPDANFEARLEALGYDDISGDGQVPTIFINTVTSLSVQSQSISDLTGIEDFTALESLDCRTNSLTSLDLTNNTALTSIDARSNNLTSIDVSNNLNLTSLKLMSNGNLETLDVSNNPLLETLECYYTNISSLDISNNTALRILNIFGTNISVLDTSNNSNLEKLECYSTNITSIDVTNNISLNTLHVGGLGLTEIDLSNNTLLSELRLNGNAFTTLDLSANTVLKTVALQQNNLSYLNINNGNNTNITGFNAIDNSELTCIIVDDAAYSTTNWTNIDSQSFFSDTNCNYTTIPDANFEAALEALGYDDISGDGQVPTELIEVVTTLDASNSSITDLSGIEVFVALQTLNVDSNSLTSLDLTSNSNLVELSCSNNVDLASIDVTSCPLLEKVSSSNNIFSSIDFSSNILLEDLSVTDNESFTDIDLSNNTLLRLLTLSNLDNLTTIDLSLNSSLDSLEIKNNLNLSKLSVKNGANTGIAQFTVNNNDNLTCIQVDDADYSTTNWVVIDDHASFTEAEYCRYTLIPDANFETALEAIIYDDVSGDGQVPTAEVEALTSLDVRSLSITNLSGIEDFVGLESLYISDNELSSVDLSNLTSLARLWALTNNFETLDISNNPLLTDIRIENNNLTSIDLSNQPDLGILQINNNQLISLDVSNNPLITRFRVNNNSLTTIDLSNNPSVQEVTVNNNALLSLNVQNGNNTNITNFTADNNYLNCILVDDANYSTTNWTTIDTQTSFSDTVCEIAYTAIPDAVFETELEVLGYDDISGDGQVPTAFIEVVTSLDVSSKSISDLTGIEDFTALVDLDAEVNNLTSLDLSNNTLLETVDLDSNDLATLSLPTNGSLVTFICNNNPNLTTVDFSGNTNLETIQCSNNGLTSVNLTGLSVLNSLSLSNNSLSTVDISSSINLATFVIGENALTSIDLSSNTSLTYLSIESNDLSSLNVDNNTALEYLIFSNNSVTSIDVSSHPALLWLHTSNNPITTIDVSNNILLEKLWVNDNLLSSIDIAGNTALVEFVCYNNAITTLDASTNVALEWFLVNDNALTSVNLQNGNNTNISIYASNNNPDLACMQVDDASYSTTNWTSVDTSTSFSEDCSLEYTIAIDVFLQGAALNPNTGEENLMRDDLRVAGLIPTTSPYGDGLTCDASVFDTTGNNAIVDWILIEFRDSTDPSTVSYSQSALLQRDGDVVDADGISDLIIALDNDLYYISVRHRNHLGIMTVSPVTLISGPIHNVNFTNATNEITYGTNAQTTSGMPDGVVAMWAGDANADGIVQYSGSAPETPTILSFVLNHSSNFLGLPSWSIDEYTETDLNLDQTSQYTGTNTDVPIILQNVLANPANFLSLPSWPIEAQLPEIIDATLQERKNLEKKYRK